jgi:hypothetical protein
VVGDNYIRVAFGLPNMEVSNMDLNIVGRIVDGVSGTIGKVIDKIAGDKVDEKTKLELEQAKIQILSEVESNATVLLQKEMADFRSFILKYEGAADSVPQFIVVLRSIIRPIMTILVFGIYGYAFLNPAGFDNSRLSMLYPLVLIVVGFWFGERALKNSGLVGVLHAKVEGGKK